MTGPSEAGTGGADTITAAPARRLGHLPECRGGIFAGKIAPIANPLDRQGAAGRGLPSGSRSGPDARALLREGVRIHGAGPRRGAAPRQNRRIYCPAAGGEATPDPGIAVPGGLPSRSRCRLLPRGGGHLPPLHCIGRRRGDRADGSQSAGSLHPPRIARDRRARQRGQRRSARVMRKRKMLTMPLTVKKARLTRERSSARTRVCS